MKTQLKDSIGFKVNITANLFNNIFNQQLQTYDIAIEQRATLEIIQVEKNITQTKIAQILGKDKTTISRTLKTLEKKGLIKKEALDKRTFLIKLTEQGYEVLEKSSQTVQAFREKIASKFTQDEINELFKSLDKVTLALSEE
ncbi:MULTISPECIES: MarR family winged helix-turn-helix transcriptional regulator [Arcobacteraceae]|uniref:HTH marR-type domain-containing protein n=1 Tax=Poseidonibacter parvus TaxID=1850254 RepID=A0A1P8KMT2_9BACT|nr:MULTISPECIES: MarR family transcriptional regulator [Arcobacteraceae]APW65835.1 hypothetical protein LPB137_08185 [Poseidonibacter parvus]